MTNVKIADDWIFEAIKANKGGPGRGNWGHEGRPGQVGGSAPAGEGAGAQGEPTGGQPKELEFRRSSRGNLRTTKIVLPDKHVFIGLVRKLPGPLGERSFVASFDLDGVMALHKYFPTEGRAKSGLQKVYKRALRGEDAIWKKDD